MTTKDKPQKEKRTVAPYSRTVGPLEKKIYQAGRQTMLKKSGAERAGSRSQRFFGSNSEVTPTPASQKITMQAIPVEKYEKNISAEYGAQWIQGHGKSIDTAPVKQIFRSRIGRVRYVRYQGLQVAQT